MTKAKRVLATGLVAVMASGMLTGCGGGGGDAGNTGGNAVTARLPHRAARAATTHSRRAAIPVRS